MGETIMSCEKCDGSERKGFCLCPVSFGLALGITTGLAFFLWSGWMLYSGVPPEMEGSRMLLDSWGGNLVHSLWVFLKGFIFGFFFALIYDFFACFVKGWWCKKCKDKGDVSTGRTTKL